MVVCLEPLKFRPLNLSVPLSARFYPHRSIKHNYKSKIQYKKKIVRKMVQTTEMFLGILFLYGTINELMTCLKVISLVFVLKERQAHEFNIPRARAYVCVCVCVCARARLRSHASH
jgi:dolichol kinase